MEDALRYVTVDVHREFERRMAEKNASQDEKIGKLEESFKQIADLVSSVKVLAVNMENMAEKQNEMSAKLDAIEQKPAKRWDMVITTIITGIIGVIIGLATAGIMP